MNLPTRSPDVCWLIASLVFCLPLCGQTPALQLRPGDDPYLQKRYWQLNDSPMQRRLRSLSPFPVGVVYYQQRGDRLAEAIRQFQLIDSLGFTALKQVQLKAPYNPADFERRVFLAAVDANLSPWYYGRGGWAEITPELTRRIGIDLVPNPENMPAIQADPRMLAHQRDVWRARIDRMDRKPPRPRGIGEPGRNNPWLPERLLPNFARWLSEEYGTLDVLQDAWNCGYTGPCIFESFAGAAALMQGKDFDVYGNGTGTTYADFRRFRDAMKFQSELVVDNYRATMELYTEWDADEPERTGGHQLFENQAMNAWDLEAQARTAAIGGSFYASIHLTHHFFLVDGEITRPVYWQARTVADMFKGGWAATWESTGGPTQWSGHQGYTVDGPTMSQLFVSYLAAGLKGVGLWMWNSRGEGWEAGEYALTDLQGEPTERAHVAGRFSRRLQEQRFELWEAMDEPSVGIFYGWETEAMLGRLSLGSYDLNTPVYKTERDRYFRQLHTEARLGISRVLTDRNVPFEYLTERDLDAELADRYPVIYLPGVIALDERHLKILTDYVSRGGRLVADLPLLMLDPYGRLNKQLTESDFARLFGCQIADYQHTFNRPLVLSGDTISGQYADLKVGTARVTERFAGGVPAALENDFGKGSAVLLNYEASRRHFRPGSEPLGNLLARLTLGGHRPPFALAPTENTYALRRAAPEADHYFLLNDGSKEETVELFSAFDYQRVRDIVGEREIPTSGGGFTVSVPARSGVWLRAEKKRDDGK